MARQRLPYNASTLTSGDYQVWQNQPREFYIDNVIDLEPFLGTSVVPRAAAAPLVSGIKLYQTIEGIIKIRGTLTFVGAPTAAQFNIFQFDNPANVPPFRSIFSTVDIVASEMVPLPVEHVPGEPDMYSWGLFTFTTGGTGLISILRAQPANVAVGIPIQTNDMITVNVEYNPLPLS